MMMSLPPPPQARPPSIGDSLDFLSHLDEYSDINTGTEFDYLDQISTTYNENSFSESKSRVSPPSGRGRQKSNSPTFALMLRESSSNSPVFSAEEKQKLGEEAYMRILQGKLPSKGKKEKSTITFDSGNNLDVDMIEPYRTEEERLKESSKSKSKGLFSAFRSDKLKSRDKPVETAPIPPVVRVQPVVASVPAPPPSSTGRIAVGGVFKPIAGVAPPPFELAPKPPVSQPTSFFRFGTVTKSSASSSTSDYEYMPPTINEQAETPIQANETIRRIGRPKAKSDNEPYRPPTDSFSLGPAIPYSPGKITVKPLAFDTKAPLPPSQIQQRSFSTSVRNNANTVSDRPRSSTMVSMSGVVPPVQNEVRVTAPPPAIERATVAVIEETPVPKNENLRSNIQPIDVALKAKLGSALSAAFKKRNAPEEDEEEASFGFGSSEGSGTAPPAAKDEVVDPYKMNPVTPRTATVSKSTLPPPSAPKHNFMNELAQQIQARASEPSNLPIEYTHVPSTPKTPAAPQRNTSFSASSPNPGAPGGVMAELQLKIKQAREGSQETSSSALVRASKTTVPLAQLSEEPEVPL